MAISNSEAYSDDRERELTERPLTPGLPALPLLGAWRYADDYAALIEPHVQDLKR